MSNTIAVTVFYRTVNMEGLEIFYREAGPRAVHHGCKRERDTPLAFRGILRYSDVRFHLQGHLTT